MATTQRRVCLLAVTTWAAGVAIFWSAIMAPDAIGGLNLALCLAPISALLWCAIALHLQRHRYRRPLLAAVCWGAASPLLGGVLIALCTPIWDWQHGGAVFGQTLIMALLFVIAAPHAFFPIGILVGVTAWLLTKDAAQPAAAPATHPGQSLPR